MTALSPPGPVAVTGASGFIGAHVCQNLIQHGYTVRACVRNKTKKDRTDHLLAMDQQGKLEIFSADMMQEGAYDEIFDGCLAVFHVAGNFGTDPRWTAATNEEGRQAPIDEAMGTAITGTSKSHDHGVYDSYVVSTQHVLDSILRSRSVKRLVYTSSRCTGPYISEEEAVYPSVQDNAYGKGKEDCERLIYNFGEKHGIICCSSCPSIVLGPLLAPLHDMVYQHRLGEIYANKYGLDYTWNVADVRDVADTQRRMAESPNTRNGFRYYNGSSTQEEISSTRLLAMLERMFSVKPSKLAGEEDDARDGSDDDDGSDDGSSSDIEFESQDCNSWADRRETTWRDPEEDLGLRRHDVEDTVRDTIVSLQKLKMINRYIPTAELRDLYNVAEIDGCELEMEYILSELKRRGE